MRYVIAALAVLLPFAVQAQPEPTATLNWVAPTTRTDGSPVELSGFKVYYGTEMRLYPNSVDVDGPGVTTYVVEGLSACTRYYFAVTAIDTDGVESAYSNESTKRTAGCAPPSAPTLLDVIIAFIKAVWSRWFA